MPRKQISIEVVQRDIDRAIRADSSHCVIATAVARAVPDATRVEVDTQTIRFTSNGKRLAYLTPLVVQGYVVAFDAGDPIAPFSFKLRDPMELRRKGLTAEAKPVAAAAARAAYLEREKARHKVLTTDADQTETPVSVSYAGSRTETIAEGRTPPPRVFKLKSRSYGHRLLRINRPSTSALAE